MAGGPVLVQTKPHPPPLRAQLSPRARLGTFLEAGTQRRLYLHGPASAKVLSQVVVSSRIDPSLPLTQLQAVYRKLGVASRQEAIVAARDRGLLP